MTKKIRPKIGYSQFLEAGHTVRDLQEAVAHNIFGANFTEIQEGSILKLSVYPSEKITWVIWGCVRMYEKTFKVTGINKETFDIEYVDEEEIDISFHNERLEAEGIRTLAGIAVPERDYVRKFNINLNEEYADGDA